MIDAHVHLITKTIMEEAFKDWGVDKMPLFEFPLNKFSIDELKGEWHKVLDKNKLEKVVFIGLNPDSIEFNKFINSSERFEGFTSVYPVKEYALKKLRKDIEAGMVGLKLYPSAMGFSIADKRCYPVYEYCKENKVPVLIHFGVTIGPISDLRYGNPIELSPVLRDFPCVNFVIAHFGAGFFREALMITYKRENVYFDTSGTNNWIDYYPGGLKLIEIFRQTLDVLGPERVIFGTDSRLLVDDYRSHILNEQRSILSKLLSSKDIELVMGENAKRIYHI